MEAGRRHSIDSTASPNNKTSSTPKVADTSQPHIIVNAAIRMGRVTIQVYILRRNASTKVCKNNIVVSSVDDIVAVYITNPELRPCWLSIVARYTAYRHGKGNCVCPGLQGDIRRLTQEAIRFEHD